MFADNLKYLFGYNEEEPMLFNSGVFFFLFTLFMAGYAFLYQNKKARIIYILLFSLYFYYKSSGVYIFVLCGTVLADYFISLELDKIRDQRKRKVLLVISIFLNIGFLLYFKYTNFFYENIAGLFEKPFHKLDIFLPIGVSFYTFQSLSYIIDVYKREIKPAENFYDYAFYMTFFPHLVAGPIVRAKFFLPQIYKEVTYNAQQISDGFFLIIRGLIKKAIIADYISQYNDLIFKDPGTYSDLECLAGMYGYAIQIFCDFSGYSDIAIGIAKLLGYELGDNFNAPYRSLNLTEFWRRWHISLSSWLRDYIYIPLGGNRKGKIRQNINLFLTMLIAGFWHGASWNYIFWGGMHGLGLFADKAMLKVIPGRIHSTTWFKVLGWLTTFHFVAFLWIFFRVPDFATAWMILKKDVNGIFYLVESIFNADNRAFIAHFAKVRSLVIILVLLVIVLGFISEKAEQFIFQKLEKTPALVKFVLLLLTIQLILNTQSAEVKPFIYFQF
jgi:alginate O-acetyltransferase complex protein AlgI